MNRNWRPETLALAPLVAVITGSAAAQKPTTDLVTEAELAEALAIVGECLQDVPPPVNDYIAMLYGDVEQLGVTFAPHAGSAHYRAGFVRTPGEQWELVSVALIDPFAEVANVGRVWLQGVFAPGVADAIAATVLGKWAMAFPERELRVLRIASSLMPSARCDAEPPAPRISYNVDGFAGSAGSGGAGAFTRPNVTFRLVPAEGGALSVIEAGWTGDPAALDGSMRQRLLALIDEAGRSERERAVAAALAAVPAPFAHARVLRSDFAVQAGGRAETLQVQLDEIDLTPTRRVSSGVQCAKELAIDGDWWCEHRLLFVNQTVSGQLKPVHFALVNEAEDFSEEFVERLVVEIRAQLPRFLDPGEAQVGIEVLQVMSIEGRILARTAVGGAEADVSIQSDGGVIRVVSLARR
jgi:hypothetical protein